MKHSICALLLVFLLSCGFQNSSNNPAVKFLNSLDANLLRKVKYDLKDEGRDDWHYFPPTMFQRPGIMINELSDTQKELFYALLKSAVSASGYQKTTQLIELEGILGRLTNDESHRDSEKYYISIYGDPSKDKAWGWRLEGHHVSMHFTNVSGKLSFAPRFFGANPAEVKSGPNKGLRVLKNEEDLGYKLISMLSVDQQNTAIYRSSTHGDIVTSNSESVYSLEPVGIKMQNLNTDQKQVLLDLIFEYISVAPEEASTEYMSRIRNESDFIRFGWAGQTKKGEPHYYRIQGKTFLIEFDNTQGRANHIHSVWRDFEGDFGRDLLKEHYENSGHH